MNSFEEWDALVELLYVNNMPKEQVLYMNSIEASETKDFLYQLGSAGITYGKLGTTDINCFTIEFARFIFHIVDTGFIPKK